MVQIYPLAEELELNQFRLSCGLTTVLRSSRQIILSRAGQEAAGFIGGWMADPAPDVPDPPSSRSTAAAGSTSEGEFLINSAHFKERLSCSGSVLVGSIEDHGRDG